MRYMLAFIIMLFSFHGFSSTSTPITSLRTDYPQRYTVQPGDTLWGIANKYLQKPWEWKILWHANPFIKNPNRLYPGAIIELRYYKHRPYLHVISNGTVKFSPHIRPMLIENPIPPIPITDIKPFLNASLIMDQDRLETAPYIVALVGEHMLGGQGDKVYVKNLHPSTVMPKGATISYAVYRPGDCPYLEPKTQRLLGFKATLVGYGELVAGGDPAVLLLTEITAGVALNDRVMFNDFPEFKLYFEPKTPLYPVEGAIIELPHGSTQGAVGLVTVIDRGQDAGLEVGDVLGIYSPAHLVPDPIGCKRTCRKKHQDFVVIPRERIGEIMIFRTFSKTSFALVVRSIRAIHLMDIITNP